MDGQVDHRPANTVRACPCSAPNAPFGETVSIKATIAAVRQLGPELTETGCQLTELITFEAVFLGRFVAFDLHE
ncbi:hypothetical protein [Mesorhizobium sp. CA7]|uniref:hypothetical protein n=1 Tax=Mesorhizobium sp. CA7 TaxID=588501 RepID=UPI001CCF14A4|nr:hypothetical protein [Mesorhizobium sp. CA7]MBZ9814740.1 hypothetical protein [Mesorhizobium sp. CA7]